MTKLQASPGSSDSKRVTPYLRIKLAAKANRGCRLSADECWSLYNMDEAIKAVADHDDRKRKAPSHV